MLQENFEFENEYSYVVKEGGRQKHLTHFPMGKSSLIKSIKIKYIYPILLHTTRIVHTNHKYKRHCIWKVFNQSWCNLS